MDRRAFALNAAGTLALAAAPGLARAQAAAPTEGRDYQTLAKPVAMPANGKIEVTEFFWYGCPHCFAFEPAIEGWSVALPPNVHFTRVPVAFDARQELHQRIYYTWEALGIVDQMHPKTFMRFHAQKKPIDSLADMQAFARESGLDADKVKSVWNSFSVQSRCNAAKRLEDDYGIDRTPEMAIAGRFVAMEAGNGRLLATTEWLVDRIRRGG